MKKFVIILLSTLVIGIAFIWLIKAPIASMLLSKDIGVPVSIQKLQFHKNGATMDDFRVKNLQKSRSLYALTSKEIFIATTLKKLFQHRITIDKIVCNDIDINVEYYSPSAKNTNWANLMGTLSSKEKVSKNQRPYLIKKMILKNIQVTLIHSNGAIKTFPKIQTLEFENISEETGFPMEKIEQAIFKEVIRSIFQKIGLQPLLEVLNPLNLPHLLPFPF